MSDLVPMKIGDIRHDGFGHHFELKAINGTSLSIQSLSDKNDKRTMHLNAWKEWPWVSSGSQVRLFE